MDLSQLSDREIAKGKKAFQEMDIDGDGSVSWEDYEAFLLKKKQNAFYTKLHDKQKQLLSHALKHFGNRSSGEDSDDNTPQKSGRKMKKKKK